MTGNRAVSRLFRVRSGQVEMRYTCVPNTESARVGKLGCCNEVEVTGDHELCLTESKESTSNTTRDTSAVWLVDRPESSR
jgi:hypothetical protein